MRDFYPALFASCLVVAASGIIVRGLSIAVLERRVLIGLLVVSFGLVVLLAPPAFVVNERRWAEIQQQEPAPEPAVPEPETNWIDLAEESADDLRYAEGLLLRGDQAAALRELQAVIERLEGRDEAAATDERWYAQGRAA